VTWLLAGLGLSIAGWAAALAHSVLHPERRHIPPPEHLPTPAIHSLRAPDGAAFDLWRMTPSIVRGRILLCHGYYADRGQVLGIAGELFHRGFEALVMELRGHGERPGPCTFGAREAEDALIALRAAQTRPGAAPVPLGVLGLSLGAAVMCQVAARSADVKAVVADSPYARLFPVLRGAFRQRYRRTGWLAAWVAWPAVQLWIGRRLARQDPAVLAQTLRQPLLMIQGGQDQRVTARQGQELYDRWAGPKERWHDPAIAHVGMFISDPAAYGSRVAAFFERTLS
jgi:alpha-beta hydrolase superfamily lysophospholipase